MPLAMRSLRLQDLRSPARTRRRRFPMAHPSDLASWHESNECSYWVVSMRIFSQRWRKGGFCATVYNSAHGLSEMPQLQLPLICLQIPKVGPCDALLASGEGPSRRFTIRKGHFNPVLKSQLSALSFNGLGV